MFRKIFAPPPKRRRVQSVACTEALESRVLPAAQWLKVFQCPDDQATERNNDGQAENTVNRATIQYAGGPVEVSGS